MKNFVCYGLARSSLIVVQLLGRGLKLLLRKCVQVTQTMVKILLRGGGGGDKPGCVNPHCPPPPPPLFSFLFSGGGGTEQAWIQRLPSTDVWQKKNKKKKFMTRKVLVCDSTSKVSSFGCGWPHALPNKVFV